jgi:hypothetical protein
MDQPTFADLEYQGQKRKTRRELFLRAVGYGKERYREAREEHGTADAVVWLGQAADGEGKLGT